MFHEKVAADLDASSNFELRSFTYENGVAARTGMRPVARNPAATQKLLVVTTRKGRSSLSKRLGIKLFVIVFTALAYGTSTRSKAPPPSSHDPGVSRSIE
jgi:hypothetical protein